MYGPETFATYKAWSSDNTLSGLSMKSLLDLGMSLPSTAGHSDHEMPPKHGQIWLWAGPADWKLALASCLYKDWIMTTTRCWPSTPPRKELRVETKNKAFCALEKPQENRPSDSQIFSGKDFYESNFLHLLPPRETLVSRTNVWTWFSWLHLSSFPTSINLWAIYL